MCSVLFWRRRHGAAEVQRGFLGERTLSVLTIAYFSLLRMPRIPTSDPLRNFSARSPVTSLVDLYSLSSTASLATLLNLLCTSPSIIFSQPFACAITAFIPGFKPVLTSTDVILPSTSQNHDLTTASGSREYLQFTECLYVSDFASIV